MMMMVMMRNGTPARFDQDQISFEQGLIPFKLSGVRFVTFTVILSASFSLSKRLVGSKAASVARRPLFQPCSLPGTRRNMPRPIGLLVPARQSDSRQNGRFTCDLVEGVAVNDPHVLSIPELNDTPRGQGSKRSANSLKRHSDVPSDVRAIHRQRDFRDLLAFGNVELFDELQKHRELSDGSPLAKQKCVALRLPQLLAQLADDMKIKLGILGKLAAQ
jgi:hypothetical protein